MAQWIGDGYDETGELDDFQFEYRPLPQSVRWALTQRLSRANSDLRPVLVAQIVREQMIGTPELPSDPARLGQLFRIVAGMGTYARERADEWNLRSGVRLLVVAPQLAAVSCQTCRLWAFDPRTGEFAQDILGNRLPRQGETLCDFSPLCPAGSDRHSRRLSEKNLACFQHWQRCRASGKFPADPYVQKNAHLIEWAVERARKDLCRTKSTVSLMR